MPQAMERSLATPIIKPRFPAISGPGFEKSISVMTFTVVAPERAYLNAAFSGSSHTRGSGEVPGVTLRSSGDGLLASQATEHEGGICSAEPEAVRHHTVKINAVEPLTYDGHALEGGIEFLDVG